MGSTGQTKENSAMFPVPLLLLFLHQSSAFSITSAEPSEVLVRPGDTVRMLCVVDEHYEWCKFYHPSQGYCDYEWKRISNNITRQECALNLSTRLVFHGQYDDRQCGVEFKATTQDTGVWKCEIEEYVMWKSRGAGKVQTALMRVTVQKPETPQIDITENTTKTTENTAEPTATTLPELSTAEIPAMLNISDIDSILQAVEEDAEQALEGVHQVDHGIHSYNTTKIVSQEQTILGVMLCIGGLGLLTVGAGILLFIRRRRRIQPSSSVYYDNLQEED